MNLPPAIQLITASLDLQMVRLIRGAIAENNIGHPRAEVHPARRNDAEFPPRPTVEPEPRFEPRPVHHPEPEFAPRAIVEVPPVEVEPERPVAEAFGPLPAPWQALLREKVWNRPVATPAEQVQSGPGMVDWKRGPAPTGRLIDAFL